MMTVYAKQQDSHCPEPNTPNHQIHAWPKVSAIGSMNEKFVAYHDGGTSLQTVLITNEFDRFGFGSLFFLAFTSREGQRSFGLRFAILLVASLQTSTAWAVGGYESMDRPSEYRSPLPGYAPRHSPEGFTLPTVPENPPSIEKDNRKLSIKHIIVHGNTAIPEEDIRSLIKPFEGRGVSVVELEDLRQKITRLYIDRGYINSGAIIPEDAYKEGVVHFDIIEGRLDEVQVKGQGRLREGYIQNRLQGDPEKPLNLQELEDRFQLLLSDPLISKMNGRILPGASPGHSILDVDVVRARSYHLTLFGDNFRPPSIGAEAFGLTGYLNNLTGLGDTLDFTFVTSSGSNRYSGGFNLPLTDSGTLAFFRFDEGDTVVVEAPFQDLDIKSKVHILEGGISHPIINTFNQRLNLGVLLTTREAETSLLGRPFSFVEGVPTDRNQATVWRIFQDFIQRWERTALAFRSTFSVGMDALGATPAQDDFPSSEFFAWLGQLQYAYLLDDEGTQLILRGNAQVTDSRLLPLEQIAIGGVSTVRGYRTNYLVRDEGYSLSLELRYPLLSFTAFKKQNRLTLVPFFDYGEAWNRGKHSDALLSLGAGFNWQLENFNAEFYYGYALKKPLGQQSGDLQDDGVYFQVKWDVF